MLSAGVLLVGVPVTGSAQEADPPGNNGTLKVHEEGTPDGTESNDPKVCSFNIEGFDFDAHQLLVIRFDPQGGSKPLGTAAGPFGPYEADDEGYFDTEYFDLADGTYKTTALGKDSAGDYVVDLKAKSKVFKVECEPVPPSETGSLQWLKYDGDEHLLGGATFEVCRTHDETGADIADECGTVRDNAGLDTDDTAGELSLANLALGTWTVEETDAPNGFVKDSDVETVTVTATGQSTIPIFVNIPQQHGVPGTLRWFKHNDNQQLLGGATFQVCRTAAVTGAPIVDTCLTVTDNSAPDVDETAGELQLEQLALGTWTIKESSAPAGYILDSTTKPVILTADNASNADGDPLIPVFVNTTRQYYEPKGTLRWLKHDEGGDLLGGATFQACLGTSCVTVVDNSAPDTDPDAGEFELRELALGTWTITEVEAPDGFVRDIGAEPVILSADNPANAGTAVPVFVNVEEAEIEVLGDLGWLKVDDQQEQLGGATFEVCHTVDINGSDIEGDCLTVVDNRAPDVDADAGELALSDVPLGVWTIEETKAPKGYDRSTGVETVVLTEANPSNLDDDPGMPTFVNVLSEIEGEETEKPQPTKPAKPEPKPVVEPDEVLGTEAAVPTEVDAGLVGPTDTTGGSSSPFGQALVGAGLMLLVLAATMRAGRRERGVHEA